MTAIAEVAGIVDRAAADAAFRQELLRAPVATLQGEGIDVPAGSEVRVLENTAGLRHLVLPARPDGFEDDEPPGAASGGARSPAEALHAHARLVIDSWSDGDLRARLLADPASVMAERGIALPGDVAELRVVEPDDRILYLVIPPAAGP